jgi:two-component system cell cycle response regulator DivK
VKKRILIAEDNGDMAELYRLQFEMTGYEVMVARNGIEAVEMASAKLPDVIIMDIQMPKMNGLEATRQLRENPATREIPILAATAKAMDGVQEKCLAVGCNGYIAKPFSLSELQAAISALFPVPD